MKGKIIIIGNLAESKFNKEKKVIEHVALLSSISKNKRRYLDPALDQAVVLLEGCKSFMNHQVKDKRGETRDVMDLIGIYHNTVREGNRVFGDLHLVGDDSPEEKKIVGIAENMPEVAGNSIVAQGRYHREDGWDLIEEFTKMDSVDIVTDPATTSSLFESIEEIKEDIKMDYKDVKKDELKTSRNDIYEAILKEGAASRDTEVKDLKKKIDDFEVKEAVTKKKENVQKILKESKISEDLVTETFVDQLNEAKDDDAIKAIIEDRKLVAKDAKAGVKNYGAEKVEDLNEDKKGEISDDDLDSCFDKD